ncbi:MAG: pyridoxamine 5'-phosphate oxidase family protein [Kiritimatiellia bacterium]
MRRAEQKIKNWAKIDSIVRRSQVCHLGLSGQGTPYVVPLCFGYDGRDIYFHCASSYRRGPCKKVRALALIVAQYSKRNFSFPPDAVSRTVVVRI